jgi:hypothetical protein
MKKKRYIITTNYTELHDVDSLAQIGKLLGCSRQHISQQLKVNTSRVVLRDVIYHVLDRLAYDYHEARQ